MIAASRGRDVARFDSHGRARMKGLELGTTGMLSIAGCIIRAGFVDRHLRAGPYELATVMHWFCSKVAARRGPLHTARVGSALVPWH